MIVRAAPLHEQQRIGVRVKASMEQNVHRIRAALCGLAATSGGVMERALSGGLTAHCAGYRATVAATKSSDIRLRHYLVSGNTWTSLV